MDEKKFFSLLRRQEYIDLAKDFLANQITADDFLSGFMGIYEGVAREIAQMGEDESFELKIFLKTNQSGVDDLLSQIYGTCNYFGQGTCDEKELKDCALILLMKLQ